MGIHPRQLLERVIRPTLRELGPQFASEAAEHLVLGTAAQESNGFQAIVQYRGGPAVGLWQMEPATFRDHWRWLSERKRDDLWPRVLAMVSRQNQGDPPDAAEMIWNFKLACAMCRIHYWRRSGPLPEARDVPGFATIWKRAYNTPAGKGTEAEFIRNWERYVAPHL